MSYCVHCGVELAPSESACPLCRTPVCDPVCPWEKPEKMPYPDRVEDIMQHIDLSYGRRLALLVLLIPSLVVLAVNLLSSAAVSWSLYVIGALACFYTWVMVPFFYRFKRPYAYISLDFIMLALYLLLIALMTDGMRWYWMLALPVLLSVGAVCQLISLTVRRLEWQPLVRAAVSCLLLAVFLVSLDFLADRYIGHIFLNWSIYAGLPLLVLGGIFYVLEKKKGLKDSIKKHLFI